MEEKSSEEEAHQEWELKSKTRKESSFSSKPPSTGDDPEAGEQRTNLTRYPNKFGICITYSARLKQTEKQAINWNIFKRIQTHNILYHPHVPICSHPVLRLNTLRIM